MTAEALSPPDAMQLLRARLIREGKIVPAEDSNPSTSVEMTTRERVLELIRKLNESLGDDYLERNSSKSFRDHYLKALKYYFDAIDACDSEFSVSNERVVINYYFSLSVKHLKIIFSALNSFGKLLSNRVVILRSGFFFAFKENMKNTP